MDDIYMSSASTNDKRIVKNTIALSCRMFITILIGIYTSRFLLANLGVTDYGVYNVVGGVISMFTFLNTTLINGTQRYFNFYLGRKDQNQLNEAFCTSVSIFFILALIICLLAETIGLWFVNNKLEIPDNRMIAANWVFQFTILSAFVNIISAPYNALIIAYERMSTFAYVSIIQSICMFGFAYLIPFIPFDKLIGYSALVCILFVGIRVFYSLYCRITIQDVKYEMHINVNLFKELFSFSGWTLTGTFAYMTYNQGLSFLLNMTFGPVVNAAHSLAQQVSNSLNGFSSNFLTASKPQITKYYAEGDFTNLRRLLFLSSKMAFVIMSLVSMPFIVHSDLFLSLWLEEIPPFTSVFLKLILISTIWNTLSIPAVAAIHSTGIIKRFQICESLSLICILPFSFLALMIFHSPVVVFYVMFFFLVVTQFIRLIFLHKQIGIAYKDYIIDILVRLCVSEILALSICSLISTLFPPHFLSIIVSVLIEESISLVVSFIIGLNKNERRMIINLVKRKLVL